MTSSDASPPITCRPRAARQSLVAAGLAFALILSAPLAAHAQRTAGDIESARQAYNEGIALRDKGDAKGALEKFKAAHALGNTPITGIELCKSYAAQAQPVEAREVCLGVARIPPLAGETARSQEARTEAARVAEDVKPRIANVRIVITGAPPGREPSVTVDGSAVPAAALGQARAVNPGQHTIVAKIGAGPEARSNVELREGETKEVTLPVQAPADIAVVPPPGGAVGAPPQYGPPPERPREKSNGLATAGWIVGGIGLGVGAITGIVAMAKKSDLADNCTRNICGPSDYGTLDSANTFATVSTIGFVVGGLGIATGIIATVTAPKSASAAAPATAMKTARATLTPDVGPGGVGFHGAF